MAGKGVKDSSKKGWGVWPCVWAGKVWGLVYEGVMVLTSACSMAGKGVKDLSRKGRVIWPVPALWPGKAWKTRLRRWRGGGGVWPCVCIMAGKGVKDSSKKGRGVWPCVCTMAGKGVKDLSKKGWGVWPCVWAGKVWGLVYEGVRVLTSACSMAGKGVKDLSKKWRGVWQVPALWPGRVWRTCLRRDEWSD